MKFIIEIQLPIRLAGMVYQFVYIQRGSRPIYPLISYINLTYSERAIQLLEVLKAICKLQNTMSVSPVIS